MHNPLTDTEMGITRNGQLIYKHLHLPMRGRAFVSSNFHTPGHLRKHYALLLLKKTAWPFQRDMDDAKHISLLS